MGVRSMPNAAVEKNGELPPPVTMRAIGQPLHQQSIRHADDDAIVADVEREL